MTVEYHGTPNIQRVFEFWAAIIADREGREVVPGSVKVKLKSEAKADDEVGKLPGLSA